MMMMVMVMVMVMVVMVVVAMAIMRRTTRTGVSDTTVPCLWASVVGFMDHGRDVPAGEGICTLPKCLPVAWLSCKSWHACTRVRDYRCCFLHAASAFFPIVSMIAVGRVPLIEQ